MFDVSFSELMVIAVVALLVIGPEKLPKVARTLGAFTGRMQRYMAQIKEEVNREVRFEELQKLQQEVETGLHQAKSNLTSQAEEVAQSLTDSVKPTEKMIKKNTKTKTVVLTENKKSTAPRKPRVAKPKSIA